MTDREALIILTAGFAGQGYTARGAIDEAIAALALIDGHVKPAVKLSPQANGCTVSGTSTSWPKEPRR